MNISRLKKIKWFIPLSVAGVVSLATFQVVSCGASANDESIKINGMSFKNVTELSEWAKNNLKNSNVNKDYQWSIFDGDKNVYFDSPQEAREFLTLKNIGVEKAYLSDSVNNHLDKNSLTDSGRIVNYPLSSDPNSLVQTFKGKQGIRFLTLDDATSSLLQIHNAYFLDGKYFLNKESLEYYLRNDNSVNWNLLGANFNTQKVLMTADGKQTISQPLIENKFKDSDTENDATLKSFVDSTSEKFYENTRADGSIEYLELNGKALQSVGTLPYIKLHDDAKGRYLMDISKNTPGTLFAPYIFESETNPTKLVHDGSQWQKYGLNEENAKYSTYVGSSINTAYGFIMDNLNLKSFTELLFSGDTIFRDQVEKDSNKEICEALLEFSTKFNSLNIAVDSNGWANQNVKTTLIKTEENLAQGKKYGFLTSIPVLRSILIDWLIQSKSSNEMFQLVNKAFDAALKLIDIRVHEEFDSQLTDSAKMFSIARVFDFKDERKQLIGTNTYIERIINNKSENISNPGGLELSAITNAIIGVHSLLSEQVSYVNGVNSLNSNINYLKKIYLPENLDKVNSELDNFSKQSESNSLLNIFGSDKLPEASSIKGTSQMILTVNDFQKYAPQSADYLAVRDKINDILHNIKETYENIDTSKEIRLDSVGFTVLLEDGILDIAKQDGHPEIANQLKTFRDSLKQVNESIEDINKRWENVVNEISAKSTRVVTELQKSIAKNFGTVEKLFKVTSSAEKTFSFVTKIENILRFTKFVKGATLFGTAISLAIELGFSIYDAIEGSTVSDTYRILLDGNQQFIWNGGSHKEHNFSFFGIFNINFGSTDEVDASAINWINVPTIASSTSSSFYSMGKLYADENELKEDFINKLLNGEITDKVVYHTTFGNASTSVTDCYANTKEELVRKIKAKINEIINAKGSILTEAKITKNGIQTSSSLIKDENVKSVMTSIKPLWIAQLPTWENGNYKVSDFLVPATLEHPLYGVNTVETTLRNEYYIFDQNKNMMEFDGLQIIDKPDEAKIRRDFIEKFNSTHSIENKFALKYDAIKEDIYDKISPLIYKSRDSKGVPETVDIYVARDMYGNEEKFIDKIDALIWLQANSNFAMHKLNAGDQWYEFESNKFLSVTEFVKWVLKMNGRDLN